MLRYAITDRTQFPGKEREQLDALLDRCATLAHRRIDYIQLRETNLPSAELALLARAIREAISPASPTRLLINSRPDVAIASGSHGVHLTAAADALTPEQVRQVYAAAGLPRPYISISCHTVEEVAAATRAAADLALFGPVFGKTVRGVALLPAVGLAALVRACQTAPSLLVLALGGITEENQASCLQAGAAGIAGIRIFASDRGSDCDAQEAS